ncbi:DDHD-domain-containing protein, partial [Aureobasidium melanogenum]
LAAGINRLSPWGPRSPVTKPQDTSDQSSGDIGLRQQRGGDHKVSHRHRLSLKRYPRDCPPLRVQWFFAVDVPKRKPVYSDKPLGKVEGVEAPKVVPKKYAPFSQKDSRAIERAFHRISKEDDAAERRELENLEDTSDTKDLGLDSHHKSAKVPVNEDYLFDVDVLNRELAPAYWLGPVYEVRRGTWFYQEGTVQKPCDENLAAQLEEQYLRATPWKWKKQEPTPTRSASQSRSASSSPLTSKGSLPNLRDQNTKNAEDAESAHRVQTYRLFGPHSNSVVTYQDTTTAWILTDDFISRMSSGVYRRFAGGAHYAGIKVTRGYVLQAKKPEEKESKAGSDPKSATADVSSQEPGNGKGKALVPSEGSKSDSLHAEVASPESEKHRLTLEQQMSSLVNAGQEDPQKQEEEVRKRDEKEIQD